MVLRFTMLLFMLLPLLSIAQQMPQYSQYIINNYLINPAIAGIEDYADVKVSFRSELSGVEGSPTTYYMSGHMPLGNSLKDKKNKSKTNTHAFGQGGDGKNVPRSHQFKPHHGLGVLAVHDGIGAFSKTEFQLGYAYHLRLSKSVKLASGIRIGAAQESIDNENLYFATPGDMAGQEWSTVKPNIAMGFWLYSSYFYVGFASAQLLANSVNFDNEIVEHSTQFVHHILTAAAKYPLTENIALIPAVMVMVMKTVPGSIDVNMRVVYNDRIWAGATYRQNNKYVVLAGVNINHLFDLGYAYDKGAPAYNDLGSGAHEVVLGMRISNKAKVLCPQNLW
jgi:type IX secretion system PorP/SprF family membrane protein